MTGSPGRRRTRFPWRFFFTVVLIAVFGSAGAVFGLVRWLRHDPILGQAHITCTKNGIPNDPQKPMVTSGIRLGSPAMTTRGFGENEARQTAHLIADVLDRPHDAANIATVREKVARLTRDFPVYG